jgi:hypothetical protein
MRFRSICSISSVLLSILNFTDANAQDLDPVPAQLKDGILIHYPFVSETSDSKNRTAEFANFAPPVSYRTRPSVYADTISCNLPQNNFSTIPIHLLCINSGTGQPIPNCKFIYELSENIGEGGHTHSGRPLGEMAVSSAIVPLQGYVNTYTATDVSGIVTLSIYIEIGASRFGPFNYGILIAAEGEMVNMYWPGYLEFDVTSHPGDGMYLNDQRPAAQMADIISSYNAAFKGTDHIPSKLVSGGASLSRGGLFDISKDWNPSHCGHRNGREIDISHRKLTKSERNALKNIITNSDYEFRYSSESPDNSNATHWHLAF